MSRITRGIEPATFISTAHMSGTSPRPSSRAARAGNPLVMSGVAVNITEMSASVSISFACSAFDSSSAVDRSTSSLSSRSSWIAPRIALTPTLVSRLVALDVRLGAACLARDRQQRTEFGLREVADLARRERAEVQRAELPAHEVDHGMPDGLEH